MRSRAFLLTLVVAAGVGLAACDSDTTTSPSTTTPETIAAPTMTDTWSSTLAVGSSKFYSFTVVQNGTVNATLTSISGVPSDVALSIGLGTPSGFGCTAAITSTSPVTVDSAVPHVTTTFTPGVHCVIITDSTPVLPATASFVVTVDHP